MQVPRENFYGVCIGNPPSTQVLAWWTSTACAKRGFGVQTISCCAESRWMGKGEWGHQVTARSDLVAGWKMWCSGCSWGVWYCLELGSIWEQPVKRSIREDWDMKLTSFCHCLAAELGLLLLLYLPLLLLKNIPVNEGVWKFRSCWNGS